MRAFRGLIAVPGYGVVAAGSLLWHATRWGSLVATALLMTDEGVSPLTLQLVGALFFAPLLLASAASAVSRVLGSPRAVVLVMQCVLVPAQLLMFGLVSAGIGSAWVAGPFMVIVGLGNTVNMTSQRMLIHQTAGEAHSSTAMAVDPLLSGVASMLASFGAGVLIDLTGHAWAYAVLAVMAVGCVTLTLRIPRQAPVASELGTGVTPRRDAPVTRAMIRSMPAVVALVAVTVTMNLCVFGYQPLVPKIAERFSSSAALAGALTAAAGVGQLVGGAAIASRVTQRRLTLLFAGSAVSIVGLMAFSLAGGPVIAFLALFLSGLGQSGFSAMQSVLAVEPRDPGVRLAVLGTVATAIGAMPIGMMILGGYAEWLGPRGGVLLSASLGLALLTAVGFSARRAWLAAQWGPQPACESQAA